MDLPSLFLFSAAVAVDVWAIIAVMCAPRANRIRSAYCLVELLSGAAALAMTQFFSYYSNPNTHILGWPIPRVVFQRDTPDSPWLDFIGPTIVLAYPMNFVLYLFIPSVIFLLVTRRQKDEIPNAGNSRA
jgi:hypothetical protein